MILYLVISDFGDGQASVRSVPCFALAQRVVETSSVLSSCATSQCAQLKKLPVRALEVKSTRGWAPSSG